MNICIISGNAVREPELKRTQSGTSVCTITIANNVGYGENKKTTFCDVVAWGKTAEYASTHIYKGTPVVFSGSFEMREWTDKDGNKRKAPQFNATNVDVYGKSKADADEAGQPSFVDVGDDDDLPF